MREKNRRDFLRQVGSGIAIGLGHSQAAPGQDGNAVRCNIVEAGTGNRVHARIRLLDRNGNEVIPPGHPEEIAKDAQQGDVRYQSRRYCYIDGTFTVDPRSLPLRYQVLKGFEYLIAEGELTAGDLKNGQFAIPVSRWSDLASQGWFSGDIHIHHISPKTCRMEMDAEDLNIANILTSDFTADQQEFEGRVNANSSGKHLIYVSQEYRHNHLGHMCVLNLKKLIEPVKPMQPYHYPPLARACDEAHAQGGYVSWAHFPSWPGVENPVDVALEKLDGLEILCVLDPAEFPIFMKQVVPELESNDGLRLWYRYLNSGFRLTATAGTDKMTTFVTVGANRVYAQMEDEFNYQNWIAALKRGRTFITNSPILSFRVAGKGPGETIELKRSGEVVEVHARAESQIPYDRLQIVCNGAVIADASPGGVRHRAELSVEYPVKGSCWLAARVIEDLRPYRERGVNFQQIHVPAGTRVSDLYGTRRPETTFAHSSPVYVLTDGKPIRSWDDANYYVRYLDNSIQWLEKDGNFRSRTDRASTLDLFRQARSVYVKRAGEAGGGRI